MYYYIVNPSSGDRSFESIQVKLKAKLRQLGIDGEFAKTLDEGDAAKITHAALRQGAKTIVVVAGDKTVNEVITAVDESGRSSASVGIIPVGHNNTLANTVGINDWQQACELLAARRLRNFKLMHINDYNFIHSCTIKPKTLGQDQSLLEIDGSFRLRTTINNCFISNTKLYSPELTNRLLIKFNQSDDDTSLWSKWLRRQSQSPSPSQLQARVVIMELPDTYTANIDGREIENSYFRIRMSDKPVQLITAKHKNG